MALGAAPKRQFCRAGQGAPGGSLFGGSSSAELIPSGSACPASAGRALLLLLHSDGGDGIPELVQQRGEHPHIAGLLVRDKQGEPVQAGLGV